MPIFRPSTDQSHAAQMARRACNGRNALDCCLQAQKGVVQKFSSGISNIVGLFTDVAATRSNRAQGLFFQSTDKKRQGAALPVGAGIAAAGILRAILVPAAGAAQAAASVGAIGPLVILPSFAALGNAYGALVFANVVNDFSEAVLGFASSTEIELGAQQAQERAGAPRVSKKFFDCDKCVRTSLFAHPLGPPNGQKPTDES